MLICVAGAGWSAAPDSSPRPMARNAVTVDATGAIRPLGRPLSEGDTDDPLAAEMALAVVSPTTLGIAASALPPIRPVPRPGSAVVKPSPVAPALTSDDLAANTKGVMVLASSGTVRSLRPASRPGALEKKAMAKRQLARKGAVCGDIDLQGSNVGRVPGRISACGIKDAVKLRSVSGVRLSQESVMDCTTAKTIKTWVETGVKPAFGSRGGGLSQLKVAAHYSCRTRNNQPGAKVSEHGKGRAIDISGFVLRDGTTVTVLKGWRDKTWSATLKKIHRAACGPFGTVLGPDGDRYHQDHLHMDTARYRSGSFCR
nr:extensin family protein [Mesobacterium pallidum]